MSRLMARRRLVLFFGGNLRWNCEVYEALFAWVWSAGASLHHFLSNSPTKSPTFVIYILIIPAHCAFVPPQRGKTDIHARSLHENFIRQQQEPRPPPAREYCEREIRRESHSSSPPLVFFLTRLSLPLSRVYIGVRARVHGFFTGRVNGRVALKV